MNVRLPDGTLLTDVPEGISKADLTAKLARNGYDVSKLGAAAPPPPPKPEADSAGSRFLSGLADPIYGAAQIADKAINPIRQMISPGASSMEDVIKERNANYHAPEGMDVARMAGNIANPVSWAGGGAGIGRAAAQGAFQSALAPTEPGEDFWTQKAKDVAIGGAAGGALAKVLPRFMGGRVVDPTAEAAALQRAGIVLTPGQSAGGFLNSLEQKATSVPGFGDIIGKARDRSLKDVQRKVIEDTGVPRAASGTVGEANDAVSELYQKVVPKLRATGEAELEAHGAVARAGWNPELTAANRDILEGLHTKLFGVNGDRYMQLSGGALKDLDTELGALARKYEKSVLPSDHTLGEEIRNMQQAMREGWRHHLGPEDAGLLDAANKAYKGMIPVNKAASKVASEIATPRALQKAMAQHAGKDVTRLDEPFIRDAVKVLDKTVPDSGTSGRAQAAAAIAAVTGGAAVPPAAAAALLGLGGTAAAYSRTGSKLLTGNTDAQRWLEKNVGKLAPETRKAFIAALRAKQAEGQHNPDEE